MDDKICLPRSYQLERASVFCFAKFGHKTITFLANEQRLRKHMNAKTITKKTMWCYTTPHHRSDLSCFSFRLQLQETLPSSSFLAIFVINIVVSIHERGRDDKRPLSENTSCSVPTRSAMQLFL